MANTKQAAPVSNFWTGFSVGATVLFFLGTKKGRTTLRGLMEYVEDLEDNLTDLMKSTSNDGIENKLKSFTGATSISDLITKIQSTIPDQKKVKNFFESGGKTLKSS